jgi:tetratricopeptide (TPR) repeat protein
VNINTLRKYIFAVAYCVVMISSFGQTYNTDSLLQVVRSNKNTEAQINTLLLLSDSEKTDLGLALNYAKRAFILANETDYETGKLTSLIRISQLDFLLSDVKSAIETGLEAEKLAVKLDKKTELAIVLDGLGMLYYNLGDKKRCAEYYFSSLKISEQLDDKNMICITLSRIGLLYNDQKDYRIKQKNICQDRCRLPGS